MTYLFDQHLHSKHSWDCRTEPRDNVMAALAAGLGGLTFTEHFDTHPDEWEKCGYHDEAYSATVAALRREFGERIFIGKGIEVCYQPDKMDFILDFLAGHEFDIVLLSVHWSRGRSLHYRQHWEGLDAVSGTRLYLESVLDAARHAAALTARHGRRCFDVLGHMDFVKRYTHRFFNTVCVEQHEDVIEDILTACLEADLIPEINTSTLRQGISEAMPGPAVVQRYAALGGGCMSLGSDSHQADTIGAGFDVAVASMRRAGLNQLAIFERRERRLVSLDGG